MFTGIVEEAGTVEEIKRTPRAIQMRVRSRVCGATLQPGDSLAVNGCCLTAVAVRKAGGKGARVQFDLLEETWRRTNFKELVPGAGVNLERSLSPSGRLSGHFVTGHIDDVGVIKRWEPSGADWVLEVKAPASLRRYLIAKGSVAVDGISLTVADVLRDGFRVWIIPHTRAVTVLNERKTGDLVNLEADMIGKFVEQFVAVHTAKRKR